MSRLYNYFVSCWTYNADFTESNLDNAVVKGLVTELEKSQILLIPREI